MFMGLMRCLFLFFVLFSAAKVVCGQEALQADSLLQMSIEDLLHTKVISSTKSYITCQKAPSSIKVYSKKDFERMGLTTLREVLDMIPGFQIQESRAGHQSIWIRGVQERYNNKVLLLIDGVPMRDSYYGNFTIDESLPLVNIDKVEVINSPGSVLYGTNSFAGVINITTKSKGTSLSASYGSFNSYKTDGEFGHEGFYTSGGYYQTDGFSPEYNIDGLQREHPQNADNIYAMAKYTHKSLMIIGSYGKYRYPYKYKSSSKDYSFMRNPISLTARYAFDMKKAGRFDFAMYYNYVGFYKDKLRYTGVNTDTLKERLRELMNTALAGANMDYSIDLGKNTLLVGVSYQQDLAMNIRAHITYDIDEGDISEYEDVITDKDVRRGDVALYAQNLFNISRNLLLTTGIRYDVLTDFNDQFSYRLGLTGQTLSDFYGKILYGTAFRTPSYREYLDIKSYNDDLQPEHLNTFELQAGKLFELNKRQGDINLTYFYNIYRDYIQEYFVDSLIRSDGSVRHVGDEMYFNFERRLITGLELNMSFFPAKGLYLNLGGSFIISAKEDAGNTNGVYPEYPYQDETGLLFLSKFTANAVLSYSIKSFRAGVKMLYFSDRNTPDEYQSDVPPEVRNPKNAGQFVKLDMFAKVGLFKGLSLDVAVNNFLDQKIYSPPFGRPTHYDMEWPGITFRAGVKYIFN
jgi:outer membrane receptor for ferrienterochelin and colicin